MCVFELHDWVTSSGERSASDSERAGETLTGEVEIEREREGKQRKSHSFLPINPSRSQSVGLGFGGGRRRCCRNLREIAKAASVAVEGRRGPLLGRRSAVAHA